MERERAKERKGRKTNSGGRKGYHERAGESLCAGLKRLVCSAVAICVNMSSPLLTSNTAVPEARGELKRGLTFTQTGSDVGVEAGTHQL